MWILTPNGYLSIVRKGGDEDRPYCVRSRDRASIDDFIKRSGHPGIPTQKFPSDYNWRVQASAPEYANFMIEVIEDTTYSNFKTEAEHRGAQTPAFINFLHRVWTASLPLTPKRDVDKNEEAWDVKFPRIPSQRDREWYDKNVL